MNVENSPHQDPAFYTYGDGATNVVWDNPEAPRFYVVVNGEMRVFARHSLDEDFHIITNADDLMSFGITTDAELADWENKGHEYFEFVNNSWFEVCSTKEGDEEFYPVVHALKDAVELAKQLHEKYGATGEMVWNTFGDLVLD